MTQRQNLEEMLVVLVRKLLEGIRHGFFECTVSSEITDGGKRKVKLKAGTIHQFTVHPTEIDAANDFATFGMKALSTEHGTPRTAGTAALLPKPEAIANGDGNE